MEITEVESIVLESAVGTIPMLGGSREFDATAKPILVRIRTDEGITGIGETYLDDPEWAMSEAIARGIDSLGGRLVGKNPLDVTKLWHDLYVDVKRTEAYRALSAVDEALWDILGKHAGLPVYELLGGSGGDVHAYATFGHRKEADELVDDGQWLAEKGFPLMKIVAGGGVAEDRERIETIASNLPDGFGLAIDANTTYGYTDALAVAETASEYGLEWFEEPIAHTDIEGMARLNERASVPISAYQNHYTHYPALDHLRADAIEIYQPSLDRVGGITAARRIGTMVESFNKRLVPHAFGPGVNYAASLHVAAASPACSLIEFAVFDESVDDPGRFVASPYIENQDEIYVEDGGRIRPPDKPGLGIDLDEDALESYRVN
ncbi:MAG: mandelate racemase/muconate lactonizing enzyme family protein [Halobacteriota archaeon]